MLIFLAAKASLPLVPPLLSDCFLNASSALAGQHFRSELSETDVPDPATETSVFWVPGEDVAFYYYYYSHLSIYFSSKIRSRPPEVAARADAIIKLAPRQKANIYFFTSVVKM